MLLLAGKPDPEFVTAVPYIWGGGSVHLPKNGFEIEALGGGREQPAGSWCAKRGSDAGPASESAGLRIAQLARGP
jgi:hypothetical protein